MPSSQIKIDVGDHTQFFIQACTNTIKVPDDMDDESVINSMRMAVSIGGFGGV